MTHKKKWLLRIIPVVVIWGVLQIALYLGRGHQSQSQWFGGFLLGTIFYAGFLTLMWRLQDRAVTVVREPPEIADKDNMAMTFFLSYDEFAWLDGNATNEGHTINDVVKRCIKHERFPHTRNEEGKVEG